jgi:hypothetical protein
MALRMRRLIWAGEATVGQDWLFDMCIDELEYRARRAVRAGSKLWCPCELCQGPFPHDALEEQETLA